jgi:hypothetical protein
VVLQHFVNHFFSFLILIFSKGGPSLPEGLEICCCAFLITVAKKSKK